MKHTVSIPHNLYEQIAALRGHFHSWFRSYITERWRLNHSDSGVYQERLWRCWRHSCNLLLHLHSSSSSSSNLQSWTTLKNIFCWFSWNVRQHRTSLCLRFPWERLSTETHTDFSHLLVLHVQLVVVLEVKLQKSAAVNRDVGLNCELPAQSAALSPKTNTVWFPKCKLLISIYVLCKRAVSLSYYKSPEESNYIYISKPWKFYTVFAKTFSELRKQVHWCPDLKSIQ